ncbi:C2H2-type zinc finger transcription factor [Rhizophagus irregularis DAOM 181602=DAOM 197198]|nr:C2H2-type zinc finger transcription factor [Rhizophagus irregularis DAOM 181602=DAOM 197198]
MFEFFLHNQRALNEFQPPPNDKSEPRTPEDNIIRDPEDNPFLVRSELSEYDEETTEKDEEENCDSEEQGSDEDADIDVSGATGAKLTDASKTEYKKMYENMDETLKWRLKSGRYVEDVIYEFGCSCQFEDLSHSFIIDLEDQPEEDVITCLNAFNKTNVHDIREVMAQFSMRQGSEYTIQKDFSTDVIIYAIHSLVLLYERQPNALGIDHLENWSRYCQRRVLQKNNNGQALEFGSSEVGRFYNSKMRTKWLVESGLKLPKILRDMFTALCDRVKWRADIIQNLETVGTRYDVNVIGQSGWIYYAPCLTKGNIFEMPENVELFALALELISDVWMFKSRIQRTMRLAQNIPLDLKKVGLVNHKKVVKNKFPATFTTPRKPRKKPYINKVYSHRALFF